MKDRCVTVRLDGVQSAWLDALCEVHDTTGPCVLREALLRLVAAEQSRLARQMRLETQRQIARACVEQALPFPRWSREHSYLLPRKPGR